MKHVRTLACCMLFSAGGATACLAQGLSVDWKFYGGASIEGNSDFCFYDAKGVTQTPDSHIRVWTKCLREKDLDSIDPKTELGDRVVKNTAQKIVEHYEPPIAGIENLSYDQIMQTIQYEETADISPIEPHARIFYELNCSEQMLRELSIYIRAGGKDGFVDRPSEWKYASPETNSTRLVKILCARNLPPEKSLAEEISAVAREKPCRVELFDGVARGGARRHRLDGGPSDHGPSAAITGTTRGGSRS
jgi:hypothetical protein